MTKAQQATVEEVQEQIRVMLEEAKAQAAEIMKAAQESVRQGGERIGVDEEALAEHNAKMNELVEVKLFKDNDRYREPVFVAVNGENVVIERGVPVKIKRKFAEVLEQSDRQDYNTSKLIQRKNEEFRTIEW